MAWRFWRKEQIKKRRECRNWGPIITTTFYHDIGRHRFGRWQEILELARELGAPERDVLIGCIQAARVLKKKGQLIYFYEWLRPARPELEFIDSPFLT